MKKSVCSFLLALLMVFSLLPSAAFAATGEEVISGFCGNDLTWSLDDRGTLTISGEGVMSDWRFTWSNYKDEIFSVIIENGVTNIGDSAFRDCSNLESVTISNSVSSIGYAAFEDCSSLTSVAIPDSVTDIGGSAFYGCSSLTSVTIPDSVTDIGGAAFRGCSSLASVAIPDSVTDIGGSAFYGCSSLTSVTIPNGVTSIEQATFSGCSSLTSVFIPSSVTSIESSAFRGTPWLKSLGDFAVVNGFLLTYQGTGTDVTIPTGVTNIGDYAFRDCSSLTSVTIPGGVIDIGDSAFYGCSSLKSVKIPNSVTDIGDSAFYGCSKLTSVTIPNSITSIGYAMFYDCSSLKSVTIPNSVTDIEWSAFEGCSSLTSVSIPDSVTSIGGSAFSHCSSLTSINIPSSVTDIAYRAFGGCSKLTSVKIPESVTGIGDSAFYGCSSLTSVMIPDGVTKIKDSTFYSCSSLKSVTIPNSVTGIGADAFSGTPWVKSFGDFAVVNGILFAYQGAATDVVVPNGVISIGDGVFAQKSSLTSVMIPDGVTKIEDSAFKRCSNLKSVTIPESVTNIGGFAFAYCSSLPAVYIPAAVTNINYYAFGDCGSLARIYYGGSEAQWNLIKNSGYIPEQAEIHYGHTHDGSGQSGWVVAPTCTESGYGEYCCVCGNKSRTKGEDKLGHTAVVDPAIAATCTEAGLTEGSHCSRCGEVLTAQQPVNALGHSYSNGTCTRCGAKDPSYEPAAPTVKPDYLSSTGKPYLKWNAVSGAVRYEVYRATSKNGRYTKMFTTTKTSYTNTSAKAGYIYYYKVKAVNAGGVESNFSTAVSAICHCARPKLNSAQYLGSTGKPYLSWNSVTGASKYYVYRCNSKNGNYTFLGSTTKTSYTDNKANAGYIYYYKVKAVSKVRSSANSVSSTYLGYICHCAKPVVSITTNRGDPYLKWNAVSGASKYEIYRATSKNGTYTKIYTTTRTNYTNTSAKAGTTYYYKVKAVSKVRTSANSAFSAVKSIRAR